MAEYEALLSCRPAQPRRAARLAALYTQAGNGERALELLNRAVERRAGERDPPAGPRLRPREVGSDRRGHRRAIAVWSSSSPRAGTSRGLLADLLLRQGRADEAIALIQEGIQLDPNVARPHRDLASLYERTGRIAEAVAEYREYARLAPTSPDGASSPSAPNGWRKGGVVSARGLAQTGSAAARAGLAERHRPRTDAWESWRTTPRRSARAGPACTPTRTSRTAAPGPGPSSGAPAAAAPVASDGGGGSSESSGGDGEGDEGRTSRAHGARTRATGEQQAAQHRANIKDAEQRIAAAQQRINALMSDLVPTNVGDPFQQQTLETNRANARRAGGSRAEPRAGGGRAPRVRGGGPQDGHPSGLAGRAPRPSRAGRRVPAWPGTRRVADILIVEDKASLRAMLRKTVEAAATRSPRRGDAYEARRLLQTARFRWC